MKRFIRLNARIIATLLVQALLLATLPGCGTGGGSTAGSPSLEGAASTAVAVATSQSLSDANAAPIVMGQNGPAKMLQGEVHLTQGVAGASVTVYESDGTIAGTATTDANGAFAVYVPVDDLPGAPAPAAKTASKAAAGLATGERRYIAVIPVGASEGAGTTLMADTPAPFAHLDALSTEVSELRQADPTLSLVAAQQAVAATNGVPVDYDLNDAGGDMSPFSEGQFEADAQAYNNQHGHPGSPDLDPFLAHEVSLAQQHVAAARNKTTAPAAHPHRKQAKTASGTANHNQVNGINADNTDPAGSLDPDRQTAKDTLQGYTFTDTASFTAEQLENGVMNDFGTGAAITATAVDGFATITGLLATIDSANGNTVEKSTKVLSYIAGGLVIASVILQTVLFALQSKGDDPYLLGLQRLSEQINQGFNALSQQIKKTEAYLAWQISQSKMQSDTATMQGRLSTLQSASTPPNSGFQPYDTAQQNVQTSISNAQGPTLESSFTGMSLGLSGTNAVTKGIEAYTAESTYQAAAKTTGKGANKASDGIGYTLRDNTTTLTLRGLEMQYANAINFATRVDGYESKAAYQAFGIGFARIKALSDRVVGNGSSAFSSLRRRGLQQAPPRFPSDKIRVDASRGIAWSTDVLIQTFGSAMYTSDGSNDPTYTIDGGAFRPDGYKLDATMSRNWRLPTLSELQALPGWATAQCPAELEKQMGLKVNGHHYVAAYDPAAPDPISDMYPNGGSRVQYIRVTKHVRFYNLTTGGEEKPANGVQGRFWDGANISCLRVFDLKNLAGSIEDPSSPGKLAIKSYDRANAGLIDARAYDDVPPQSNPHDIPTRTVNSSVLRSAGIQPDYIFVIDHVIDNPWYSANPILPQQQARKVHALSAVGFWWCNAVDVGSGRWPAVVDDLSGVVEWQVDKPDVARVTNHFTEWPSVSDRAKAARQVVSPWFSTLVFSKAGTVKVTANWMQGTKDTAALNTITITETNSADLAIPPVLSALNVYPTGMLITNTSQLQGKVMSVYGELSDNTAADYNTKVQWSLLEVQLDGQGNETGTIPLSNTIATISQNGGLTAGGVLTITAGGGTLKRIRIVATDPSTGKTGKADFQLQL